MNGTVGRGNGLQVVVEGNTVEETGTGIVRTNLAVHEAHVLLAVVHFIVETGDVVLGELYTEVIFHRVGTLVELCHLLLDFSRVVGVLVAAFTFTGSFTFAFALIVAAADRSLELGSLLADTFNFGNLVLVALGIVRTVERGPQGERL